MVVGVVAAVLLLLVVPVLAIVFLGTEADDPVDLGAMEVDEETGTVTDALGNQLEVDLEGPVVEGVEPLDDGWVRYTEPDGALTVDLPAQPVATTAEVPVPFGPSAEARSLTASTRQGAVVVNVVGLADLGLPSAEAFDLDASLQGSALSTGSDLSEVATVEVDGHEGRRARLAVAGAPGGGIELVVVATDQAMIQVMGLGDLEDFERSLASVQLS